MATIDSTLERQQQLFGLIARATENLRKLGPAKTTRGNVQSRMEVLKSNWEKFQTNNEALLRSCSAEQKKLPYFKGDVYTKCEEKFLQAHGNMLDLLDDLNHQYENQDTSLPESSINASSASHSRRLPRIEIPKFSGDYSQWSPFCDLFTSMIIENTELSAVEKLHYLKLSVSGEPAQHLKNIAISNENFTRAWDALVDRYENKRILIEAHLAILFGTNKIKSENSTEIKRLLGDVKEVLGALEALGCPVRQWDLVIIFMMVRNLDSESLKRWEDSLGSQSNPPSFEIGRAHV